MVLIVDVARRVRRPVGKKWESVLSNNLFISYDLYAPGQDYERVIAAIKSVGNWAKVHKSFWYVSSELTAEQVLARVWAVMDPTDSLIVVDLTQQNAVWQNLSATVSDHIQTQWHK
jgi:hypothetical protein